MFFTKKEKLNIDSLRPVFDLQKKALLDNGYPDLLNMNEENFNNALESLWKSLSEKINTIEINIKGNIPLLLVAGQGDVSENPSTSLRARIQKINGHTELDLNNIKTEAQVNPFCILLDVEDGRKMMAKSPKDALKKFEKEKRSALTIHESVALLTYYKDTLKNHYLISAGSFYTTKDNESLPLLWLLDEHSNPELHYAWFHIAHGSYGTASYSIKI